MMHSRVCFYIKAIEVRRREKDCRTKDKEIYLIEKVSKEKKIQIENKKALIEEKRKRL
jgi:hypothetical protein